ncbi:hypothetical protein TIFTF001_040996 [Ficus carica]|uniref:Uncharacterized protein n=1 Tax=Ficus carica TaxID=3494 RepID=A0AA88CQL4_FICCA|nr:hypothetical protein TIFTF001_040996 [Ficus carica]
MDLVGGSEASTARAIGKLVSLLTQETRLIRGVDISEVQSLKDELEVIRVFLRNGDVRPEEELSDAVKAWLLQSRETAELIEDIVDEYILKASQRQYERGFVSFLGRAGRLIGTLNNRHKLSSDIRDSMAVLREIQERGQIYGISNLLSNNRTTVDDRYRQRLLTPRNLESTVGIDSAANELIQRLVARASGRSIISLVGIGGVGKTTLAQKVYNNGVIRGHFDCLAWITVSRSYNLEHLLRIMVRQIGAAGNHDVWDLSIMRGDELIATLRQYLQLKRYLFVFDDVWQEEFWQEVGHAVPYNEAGSRVIITTRNFDTVASFETTSLTHVLRVEPLSEEHSWELFCSTAFPHELEEHCPPELEHLSQEIIRMCQGLPLVIVAVAGLLSTKEKTVLEWQKLLDNFHVELTSNHHLSRVSKILALSFHDLPYYLKMCFLYFSIFDVDSLIPYEKLFKLWIAEGFVQAVGGKTLEEIAEEYLNELIRRNLVQVLRNDSNSGFKGKSRRLSISNNIEENFLETIEDSGVRSVFLSNLLFLNNSFLVPLFRKYKLLALLDFENVPLERLPEEVGNLFHLKYLSLKNTKVKKLPKSVGKLRNLQTLDVRNTLLVELPVEIKMLRNLRHLLASGYDSNISMDSTQGVRIKKGIGYLESLQTLMTVEASLTGVDLKKELEKLRGLRKLGITRLTAEVVSALCPSIEKMYHLEYQSLHVTTSHEILDLQTISSPPPYLHRLVLRGLLQTFPNWISSLQNLSMLCLSLSRDLQRLEVVDIEEGALPVLEELRIGPAGSAFRHPAPEKIQGRNYALYELGKSDLLERLQGVATNFDDVVQHDLQLSFCYSDDEADSASSSTSNVPWNNMLACDRMSFSSDRFSFFSDDIED